MVRSLERYWPENCLNKLHKKIHIISLGCPKNLIDSEVMAAIAERGGGRIVSSEEEADIVIINTCAFILPAKEESIEEIFRLADLKERGGLKHLIVTGCLPQRYGTELEAEIPEVDLFLGTGEVPHIGDYLNKLEKREGATSRTFTGKPDFLMDASHSRLISTPSHTAYLKIAEGCSNCCSYCVIPMVRGRFRSRKPDDILKEAEVLAAGGVKEIILTAQETTAYGKDLGRKPSLGRLMTDIAQIEGVKWIRLLYTYPESITEEILETISREGKICNYIDIPVQHIDDEILRMMRRRGDSALIRNVIEKAREIVPDVALRTSLIVGFPGETEEKFDRLLEFVRDTKFDHLGVFEYSREEGTGAAELPDQISEAEKESRRRIIMEEQADISHTINLSLIGSMEEVILEEDSDNPDYDYIGRLRRQSPDIDGITYVKAGGRKIGDIIRCRIDGADDYDLFAEEVVEGEESLS
jgi:ribosomal protein S12 methylthiotransferase